jgi:hypothetical protein
MQVKFEASWLRKEKRMVQETSSAKVFSQERVEVVQSRKVNGC